MRKVKEAQMKLGEVDISQIEFDLRSRDEIKSTAVCVELLRKNDSVFP